MSALKPEATQPLLEISSVEAFCNAALHLLDGRLSSTPRTVVGVCGGPGSGKSTLTASLARTAERKGIATVVVPMDGFHLANAQLAQKGIADRKGAADTFDVEGFVHLLRRIRRQHGASDDMETNQGATIFAPIFHREVEESYAGELAIEPDVDLVLVEGIHLLQTAFGWHQVLLLLDLAWYLECADVEEQTRRLIQRNIGHGRTAQQASDWVTNVDAPNLAQIDATKHRAHTVFRLASW